MRAEYEQNYERFRFAWKKYERETRAPSLSPTALTPAPDPQRGHLPLYAPFTSLQVYTRRPAKTYY